MCLILCFVDEVCWELFFKGVVVLMRIVLLSEWYCFIVVLIVDNFGNMIYGVVFCEWGWVSDCVDIRFVDG